MSPLRRITYVFCWGLGLYVIFQDLIKTFLMLSVFITVLAIIWKTNLVGK